MSFEPGSIAEPKDAQVTLCSDFEVKPSGVVRDAGQVLVEGLAKGDACIVLAVMNRRLLVLTHRAVAVCPPTALVPVG